jgi:uncharacterized protein (TIGR03435 family)
MVYITTKRIACKLNFSRKLLLFAAAWMALAASIALAQGNANQTAAAAPRFEVASIRPHQGLLRVIRGFNSSGSLLNLEGYNVRLLIMEAYNLKSYQLELAASDQQESTNYDIAARAEGNAAPTKDEFRKMLQTLLAERFNLKFHHERKETPVYAMIVGKDGPKFKESAMDAVFVSNHGVHGRNQNLSGSQITMESLADDMNNTFFVDRPVIDKTGLGGAYDLKMEATPEFRRDRNPQPEDISVFTAIQEQLGLKLDPQKANVEVLVVDHIELPSEN